MRVKPWPSAHSAKMRRTTAACSSWHTSARQSRRSEKRRSTSARARGRPGHSQRLTFTLDSAPWSQPYCYAMAHGLRVGEVSSRSGVGRKALRLYEAKGILPTPSRTPSGYRVYAADTVALLG